MEQEWKGSPKLILGVDIGTTYSGVSFLYLTEGVKPSQKIQRVTEWPGQKGNAEAKVPTLVWYDRNGNAVKLGAEAYKLKATKAKTDKLELAKHFKHHLHPRTMLANIELKKHPLPYDITLEQVYIDFMKYLLGNTKSFFEKKVLGGRALWGRLCPTMQVILAHPNGWGTPEQAFLRRVALRAGMASGDNQITFVTEAEASVHFCLSRPTLDIASSIKVGDNIIVCDAGGSTVDTTLYKIAKKEPLQLEEVRKSDCIQAGGIFVDDEAKAFLRGQFDLIDTLSTKERDQYVDDGVEDFISNSKNHFDESDDAEDEPVVVKVGSLKDDFDEIEVDSGDMIIPSYIVAGFFNPYVQQIKESLYEQVGGHDVPYMFLVGGFGDSPYLFSSLSKEFGDALATLNDKAAKAVADGCVIWQMEQSVVSRTVRLSYGTDVTSPFHPLLPHHMERKKGVGPNGMLLVAGVWSEIVKKGTPMRPGEVKRETYCSMFSSNYPMNMEFQTQIYSTGSANGYEFVLEDDGAVAAGFFKVCDISADLSSLRGALQRQEGCHGIYWILEFTIGIRFGGTEMEAFIEWEENGETRTGPVAIIAAERQ